MTFRERKQLRKRRLFSICAALWVLTSLAVPAAAGAEPPVTLRVPFPEVPGFTMTDQNGRRSGLVVDYLDEIAKYTGWNYEYINTSGEEMVKEFRQGKYDLMGGTYYSEELKACFAYPDYSCGNTKSVLLARWDDHTIRGYDYSDLNGKTIGVVERAKENVRRMEVFLSLNGLDCTIKRYSPEEVAAGRIDTDLYQGVIDVKLGNIADDTGEFRAVAYIDAQPHYLVLQPGRQELLDQLNWAMSEILSSNPDFSEDLYSKYFGDSNVHDLLLSKEEEEYVREKGTVTVAVPSYYHPFYCVGTEDGGHEGIVPELLDRISRQYGLEFSYVLTDSYAHMLQMVAAGEADLAGFFFDDAYDVMKGELAASASYSTVNDLVVRNKTVTYPGENLTCGLVEGRVLPEYAKASHVKYYETAYDVLCAVNRGEVDFACGLSAYMEQVIQAHIFNNVTPVTLSENRIAIGFALPVPADTTLLTIINKGINGLSENDKRSILDHNLTAVGAATTPLRQIIEGNPLASVLLIAAFSLFIVVVIAVISNMRIKAANMQRAVAKAEAESRAKSEFLSRMSHEIRTPMNAIVGLATLLSMNRGMPDDAKVTLTKLHTSSQYLLGLLSDILEMSRIDGGMLKIARENFSLEQVLDEIHSIMQAQAQAKQIRLTCTAGVSHTALVGDAIRLKQVLMNLLSNAIKFTPAEGRVRLTVEEREADGAGAVYYFCVSDTGVGIAQEDLPRIFKSFEQVGSNRSRSQGIGLGIPISYHIVEGMGGELQVSSQPGKGSEFYFSIPMLFAETQEPEAAPVLEGAFENACFLLAEDNALNAEIAVELLSLEGAKVELAVDGAQAVEMFLQSEPGHFDLILMDVQMPRMNGLDATKAIRASDHPDARSIPIIALTANTFQEDRNMAAEAGMDDFLAKPLDVDYIHAVLKKWLGREQ